jgi:hypothetical protein
VVLFTIPLYRFNRIFLLLGDQASQKAAPAEAGTALWVFRSELLL